MKTKAKAFTVVEIIITLAITVVVLGTIYLFFLTNTKTLTATQINSNLQSEAQIIEDVIVQIGKEAKGIANIVKDGSKVLDVQYDVLYQNGIDKISIEYLEVESGKDDSGLCNEIKYNGTSVSVNGIIISNNVSEFKVRPLDINMVDITKGTFRNTTGLEFSIVLKEKKGYLEIQHPLTIIVKFENR